MLNERELESVGDDGIFSLTVTKTRTISSNKAIWTVVENKNSIDKEQFSVTRKTTNATTGGEALILVNRTSDGNSSVPNFDSLVNEKFSQFKSIFKNDEYYDGEISKTQMFFEHLYEKDSNLLREVFSRGWLHAYKLSSAKLSDFICIASSIDYDILTNHADMLILGAWGHQSLQVKDSVLRAMESWCVPAHLYYLDSMQNIDDDHVNAYRKRVAELLRGK